MPFSNPATLSALIEGVDYFAWPCISGERFPPGFAGAAGYSGGAMRPCVDVTAGGTTATTVTWPAVPAFGPGSSTFNGIELTGWLRMRMFWDPGGGTYSFGIGGGGAARILMPANVASTPVQVWNGSGYVTAANVFYGQWFDFKIAIAADGKTTYTINGVKLAPMNTPAPTNYFQLSISAPSDYGADAIQISGILLNYL